MGEEDVEGHTGSHGRQLGQDGRQPGQDLVTGELKGRVLPSRPDLQEEKLMDLPRGLDRFGVLISTQR